MKQVAAAIALSGGRVLVTRRADGQTLEGFWEFPGGKLEAGETPQECIVRELAEELCIKATAGDVFTDTIYAYPGGLINLIGVLVMLKDTDFKLTVHDAYQWVEPLELLTMNLAPADVSIAAEIVRRYG